MRFSVAAIVLVSVVLMIGQVSAATLTVGPTQGYVVYRISVNNQTTQVASFTLNETIKPTGQNGLMLLTITVLSNLRNLTYSNTVNSSSFPEFFPYLVGVNNQSLTYGTNGINGRVHILNAGNTRINFDGQTYEGTNYQVSASATYLPRAGEVSANGTIVTLPSGLVYSAQIQTVNGYTVHVQLLQTDLSVAAAISSSLPVGLALVSIGLLAAVAFAVPSVFIRWRRKKIAQPLPPSTPEAEEKPSYWVD